MKPSHGLIASNHVIDILFYNRYVLVPINSALKSARLDFIYIGGPSIKIQFHPKQRFLANSDSVEEGVRQLLNNYTQYVYSQIDDYTRIVLKTIATAAIGSYFSFIQEQISKGVIGKGNDQWSMSFPAFSSQIVGFLSKSYYVTEGGRTQENEDWALKQTEHLEEKRTQIESMRDSLFISMGLY
jgi:hypothetical protein